MIPKFKYFNKPFLEALSDGRAARKSDIVPIVATKLKLTKEDMKLETPGGQNVLYDRISWTCVYLRKAGMVSRPRKGLYQITELGIKALNDGKELDINVDSLWIIGPRAKGGKHENVYHGNFAPQIPNQMI